MTRGYVLGGAVMLLALLVGGLVTRRPQTRADTPTGGVIGTVSLPAAPTDMAVDNQTGRTFVLNDGNNSVSLIDTHTGRLVRTVSLGIGTFPPLALIMAIDARANRVVVASRGTYISILDARTGTLLHTIRGGISPEHIAVDTRTGRTFISNALSSSVTVVDTRRGRLLRTTHVDGQPYALVVDERSGRVFVKSDGGRGVPGPVKLVSMLDGTSGRLVRTVTVGHDSGVIRSGLAGDLVVDTRRGHVFVSTPFNDSVSMIDARSGRLLHTVGGVRPESAVVDEQAGRVIVLNKGAGTASVLDSATGQLVRTVTVGVSTGWPASPVVDERTGRTFVINNGSGTVSVLDTRSGALLRTTSVGPNPDIAAVDGRSGRLFVVSMGPTNSAGLLTGPGSVSALDARSGRLLRTAPVGWEPAMITVDEWAGRALVLNVAGDHRDTLAPVRSILPFLPHPKAPCNNYGQVMARCHAGPGSVTILDAMR